MTDDLRTLAAEAIAARDYAEGLRDAAVPTEGDHDRADAVLAAVLPAHRRQVQRETLQAILDRADRWSFTFDGQTAAEWLPRLGIDLPDLAATMPETGPGGRVAAETGPAVGRETAGRGGYGCARCDTDQMALVCHCQRECSSEICSAMDQTPAPDVFHSGGTPMPDEEPLTGIELALYEHFRHLGCPSVVDPVDTEDCAGMAVEVVRFMREAGWVPLSEVLAALRGRAETIAGYDEAYRHAADYLADRFGAKDGTDG